MFINSQLKIVSNKRTIYSSLKVASCCFNKLLRLLKKTQYVFVICFKRFVTALGDIVGFSLLGFADNKKNMDPSPSSQTD